MNDVVYHYTNDAGLIGILSDKAIWCSNVLYLNDSLEWRYGVDVFEEMLQEIVDGTAGTAKRLDAALAREIKRKFDSYYVAQKSLSMNTFTPCYAASFSEEPDSLPQWRGYSTRGARYAIGFHTARLLALAGNGTSLRKIQYDREVAKQWMKNELADMVEDFLVDGSIASADMKLVDWGARICSEIGTACKDKSFEVEQEVRLRFVGRPASLDFRGGASTLVPYFKQPIEPVAEFVHSVWVGPGPQTGLAKTAVEELLQSRGIPAAGKVHVTKVPYRDW